MRVIFSDPERRNLAGILCMSAGIFFLCLNDAMAKSLTERYSPVQILFIRNIVALPFALAITIRFAGRPAILSKRPGVHLLRGALWILAAILFFTSLKFLELAEATALTFVAPVFIIVLSAVFLREAAGFRVWLAVLTGFVGVLIIVRPGIGAFQPASLLPIATALVYAILMISTRLLDPRESVWTLALYLTATGAFLTGILVPFVWVNPVAADLQLFFGVAVFGTIGFAMITQAFRLAAAPLIAPLDYSALIWATALGWIFWGELPDSLTYLGASLIVASGIVIVLNRRA
ncbi:MAG: DMT family transporter [Pseudomonadota bacterium]